jgi:hypothetical protein
MNVHHLIEHEEKRIRKLTDALIIAREFVEVINRFIEGFKIKNLEFIDEKKRREIVIKGDFASKESCNITRKELLDIIHQTELRSDLKVGYRSEILEPKYGNFFSWNIAIWAKKHEVH